MITLACCSLTRRYFKDTEKWAQKAASLLYLMFHAISVLISVKEAKERDSIYINPWIHASWSILLFPCICKEEEKSCPTLPTVVSRLANQSGWEVAPRAAFPLLPSLEKGFKFCKEGKNVQPAQPLYMYSSMGSWAKSPKDSFMSNTSLYRAKVQALILRPPLQPRSHNSRQPYEGHMKEIWSASFLGVWPS